MFERTRERRGRTGGWGGGESQELGAKPSPVLPSCSSRFSFYSCLALPTDLEKKRLLISSRSSPAPLCTSHLRIQSLSLSNAELSRTELNSLPSPLRVNTDYSGSVVKRALMRAGLSGNQNGAFMASLAHRFERTIFFSSF